MLERLQTTWHTLYENWLVVFAKDVNFFCSSHI